MLLLMDPPSGLISNPIISLPFWLSHVSCMYVVSPVAVLSPHVVARRTLPDVDPHGDPGSVCRHTCRDASNLQILAEPDVTGLSCRTRYASVLACLTRLSMLWSSDVEQEVTRSSEVEVQVPSAQPVRLALGQVVGVSSSSNTSRVKVEYALATALYRFSVLLAPSICFGVW